MSQQEIPNTNSTVTQERVRKGEFELSLDRDIDRTDLQFGKNGPVVAILKNEHSPSGFSILGAEIQGGFVDLCEGVNTVGRADYCDVVVNSPVVSSKHLTIRLGEREIHLSDDSSLNGTYLA